MKKISLVSIVALMLAQSCTKVNENVYDKYAASDFYSSPTGSDVALAGVYAKIAGNWDGNGYAGADNGWYDLNSMSSDEQVVPHRNTGDWGIDNAQLYTHVWLPTHNTINQAWNWLYRAIFSANLAVEQLTKANAEASKIAEAKVLRAFFYYLLMDDWGSVPFYTENNITIDQLPQKSRADVYSFVVQELVANVDKLSANKGGQYYGRFNKWAGYALLAKVYLNAQVYTGTAKWAECLTACNKVSDGGFTLHPGAANASSPLGYQYFELFGDVCPEDETILAIYTKLDIVGRNILTIRSLQGPHFNALFGSSGWNGTVVHKDYVDRFDNNDIRKKQYLSGQQPGGVNYSTSISSLDNPGANREDGIRDTKFYPVAPINGGGASNDFPIYRYADILLMKAECNVRLNNAATGKPFIDQVRARAGLNPLAANPTLDDIYNERGFELTWEGHRRQDMIRFDKFLLPHDFKAVSGAFRKLFPIPTSALNANKNLVQNPGY
ncbi:MAG: RagB/SusD family nutrient uptake outer membrane protein [Chitinophagaceae bacterium]